MECQAVDNPPPSGPPVPTDDHLNHPELQYLSLIRLLLVHGTLRPDRTGTGTLSLFCPPPLRIPLSLAAFPLLTTKRVSFTNIREELLWFLSGCTDANALDAKGVKIWKANGSREFLDARGLTHYREGDLGPIYGWQWRHFGAEYRGCDASYEGEGVDQIQWLVKEMKEDPFSRRLILSAWNPKDLPSMALPPCHVMAQFHISNTTPRRLSCHLYQRSADLGLGVPYNVASYALLTIMLAQVCELELGELIHTMGDAHVYTDHVEGLKVQLTREPRPWPTLEVKQRRESMEVWQSEDFAMTGYKPWPKIDLKMSV